MDTILFVVGFVMIAFAVLASVRGLPKPDPRPTEGQHDEDYL